MKNKNKQLETVLKKANQHFPVQQTGELRGKYLLRKWDFWLSAVQDVKDDIDRLSNSLNDESVLK